MIYLGQILIDWLANTAQPDHEDAEPARQQVQPLIWEVVRPHRIQARELTEALYTEHGGVRRALANVFTARQTESKLQEHLNRQEYLNPDENVLITFVAFNLFLSLLLKLELILFIQLDCCRDNRAQQDEPSSCHTNQLHEILRKAGIDENKEQRSAKEQ